MSRTFAGVIAVVLLTAAGPNGQTAAPAQDIRELTTALASADPVGRARAACGLRDLGDGAAAAIDALVRVLPDGAPVDATVCGTRWSSFGPDNLTSPGELAAGALAAIGARAFAPVFAALKHDSWIARRNAAWTLGAIDDARAVPGLIETLRDREAAVRDKSAWALGAIDDVQSVPALIAALGDADSGVRASAAWALGAIDDRRAVPGLSQALRDARRLDREGARRSPPGSRAGGLGTRRNRRPARRSRPVAGTPRRDDKVRSQAAWALGAIDDDTAVDPLVKALGDQTPKVREQAAWALGAIGDGRAMPSLLAALKDSNVSVRRQAAWAIGVIGR